ncbi:MAG: methylmalonyl-CoA mutase family protein [Bacteroidota bacterium]
MADHSSNDSIYPPEKPLFNEFPPVSREAWEEKIAQDLKGADYKEKLAWHTDSSFDVLPFYRNDNLEEIRHLPSPAGQFPFVRGKRRSDNDWEIRQDIFADSIEEANRQAKQAQNSGTDGLTFHLRIRQGAKGQDPRMHGIPIHSQEDFNALLKDLDLTQSTIHFDASVATPALAAMWTNFLKSYTGDSDQVNISFLYDPVAYQAYTGYPHKAQRKWLKELKAIIENSKTRSDHERSLQINTRLYHNAGATAAQELAFAVSLGNDYLAHLAELDMNPVDILNSMQFSMGIGSSYFIEIAKFRALRLLWSRMSASYPGIDDEQTCAFIHAQTASWNKTMYDAHNNMLRTTTEAMSAAIGGCDAITVDPYDTVFCMPDDFSQRIARNSQIILKAEAYLDKVADPAGGSYYIEELTQKMAQKAWSYVQEIDEVGGFMDALSTGLIHKYISQSRNEKDLAIATRKKVFVGTNQYPNAEQHMLNSCDDQAAGTTLKASGVETDVDEETYFESLSGAFSEGAMLGDLISELFMIGTHINQPIQPYRGAQPFERLRLQTEQYEQSGNERPTVHMIPIGHKKMRKARATFSSNIFGCAGYDIEEPIGYDSVEDALHEIKQGEPEVVVLCSSDQEYESLVPKFTKALRKLDPDTQPIAVLAGAPGEHEEAWRDAGITQFIHRGMNVLSTLQDFHTALGITKS